ncbi:MAG: MFS transporter [Porticoccaceae bacterium]|nr:MFS transporter [Porticoccaceae bacterium]|tara:strand:+ start:76 stop:1431 length:1356 start_codon:yes stop_codon:yes gene_type:complete
MPEPQGDRVQSRSLFHLFAQRRFLPFFITQFLGALNDNLFKNALLVIVVSGAVAGSDSNTNFITNLAAGLFILPYFLFSTTAGQLADRYDKALLIRRIKIAEIILMVAGCYALWRADINLMLGILFALGVQSAFFGPIKYAIIPQHLSADELLAGNAQVGMGTFVSILVGTLIGGWLVTADQGPMYVGLLATLFAVIGWLSSRHIPNAPATSAAQQGTLALNPLTVARGNLKLARKNPTVFYCIIAISWFWLYGGSFLTQVPNYAVTVLQGHPTLISILLSAFIVGVAIGSLLCHRLSKGQVEPGLVPIGGLGLSVFAVDLFFTSGLYQTANADLSAVLPLTFIALTDGIHILLDLMFIGMFGGMLVVPLYSMIQQRTEDNTRARVLSVNNIINAIFMVIGALLGMLFLSILGWSIPQFFLAVALMNAVFLSAIFALDKIFIERVMAWVSK